MVKPGCQKQILIWTLLSALPLNCLAQSDLGTRFRVNPAVCLAEENKPCLLTLSVEWAQSEVACLFRADSNQLLECGQKQQLQLKLNLDANLVLQLRSQNTGALMQQKVIRRMQKMDNPETLTHRRLSWDML